MNPTLVGVLSWLTPQNIGEKLPRYEESMKSHLGFLDTARLLVINNGCDVVDFETRISSLLPGAYHISLSKNYYDVAVHLVTYYAAKKYGYEYFIYSYDDFVWYNTSFIEDAESFMWSHPDVWCMRLPEYVSTDRKKYDVATTPKSINPDSVRHDVGAGGLPLSHGSLEQVGIHLFCETNWRPNSRPTLWRTSAFDRVMSRLLYSKIPVMQPFEAHMYATADLYQRGWGYKSAFLEGGACKTYPQDTSDRIRTPIDWSKVFVSYDEIIAEIALI